MLIPIPKRPVLSFKVLLCFSLCRILARLFGFRTQVRVLTGNAWKHFFRSAPGDSMRVINYTDTLIRLPFLGFTNAGGCLVRSMVFFSFFQISEPELRLVIGMRKDGSVARGLDGHAWLEKNGRPWQDISNESSRFERVLVYP